MSIIKSLYINNVEVGLTSKYIRNMLKTQKIANVGNIKIIPSRNGYTKAYIEIKEWHDTEIAYNFIKRINNPLKEAKLVHNEDNWWTVKVNNRKSGIHKKNENKKRK